MGEDSQVSVRIGDFGLARVFDRFFFGMFWFGANRLVGGTPGYAAPDKMLTDKVDIFAASIILLEMLLPPCSTQMQRAILLQSFHCDQLVHKFFIERLPKTWGFVLKMADRCPENRPSA